MQKMDIDALQALCAIEDTGGVTRAAERLALSQSAVSHKIRRLEDRLGRSLLARRAGGPVFTADGFRLLGYARRILALHDEAMLSLSSRPLKGALRLGMTEDTTTSDLSRILGRFARLHPEVAVRTHVAQSLTLEAELERDDIDLAILQVFRHRVRETDLILAEDSLHWVKSPDLRLEAGRPVPFLAYDEACFYRQWATDPARSFKGDLATVLTCPSSAGIVSGVLAGLGVALLNGRFLSPEMEVIDARFGSQPPGIASIVRTGPKSRSEAARELAAAVVAESEAGRSLRAA